MADMKNNMSIAEMAVKAGEVSTLLKSLAHPSRLMIVCTLVQGEFCVSELEEKLDIHQPHLSQHLTSLRDAGIVSTRRDGKQIYYSLSEDRASQLIGALYDIYCKEPS